MSSKVTVYDKALRDIQKQLDKTIGGVKKSGDQKKIEIKNGIRKIKEYWW